MRAGRGLEVLVRHIEGAINSTQGAKIESPKFMRDKASDAMREHDVVITFPGHHQLVVAIECKDWVRPVDVPVVEGFATKCQDTGVSRGVIVSPIGFTDGALKKAAAKSIACFTLEEAVNPDWIPTRDFIVQIRHFDPLNAAFKLADPSAADAANLSSRVCQLNGADLAQGELESLIAQLLDRKYGMSETVDARYPFNETFSNPPYVCVIEGRSEPIKIVEITLSGECVILEKKLPLKFLEYINASTASSIARSGVVEFEHNGWQGTVSINQVNGNTVVGYEDNNPYRARPVGTSPRTKRPS